MHQIVLHIHSIYVMYLVKSQNGRDVFVKYCTILSIGQRRLIMELTMTISVLFLFDFTNYQVLFQTIEFLIQMHGSQRSSFPMFSGLIFSLTGVFSSSLEVDQKSLLGNCNQKGFLIYVAKESCAQVSQSWNLTMLQYLYSMGNFPVVLYQSDARMFFSLFSQLKNQMVHCSLWV